MESIKIFWEDKKQYFQLKTTINIPKLDDGVNQ